jgi:hypothetical protein
MRRTFAAAIGMVSVAAVLGGTGLAAASTTPAASGIEHFQFVNDSATSTTPSVIASGKFTAGGVDIQGAGTDTLKLPGGTFKLRHSPGTGKQSSNPRTCLATIHLHGTYTLGHGTGRYAGISGHGTYKASILAIGQKVHGTCSRSRPPAASQLIINASGPVSLP